MMVKKTTTRHFFLRIYRILHSGCFTCRKKEKKCFRIHAIYVQLGRVRLATRNRITMAKQRRWEIRARQPRDTRGNRKICRLVLKISIRRLVYFYTDRTEGVFRG